MARGFLCYKIYRPYNLKIKPGPKPKGKVTIKWSPDFAYAIGLIATDGNLSSDGRHISFVSKDIEQVRNFLLCLGITNHVGITVSGLGKISHRTQFSDIFFYQFLNSIGLFKTKSKTIGPINLPDHLFFDFLRGVFDGDGTVYSYWDKRWKSSFMFYVSFATASQDFMEWLRTEIHKRLGVMGHVKKDGKGSTYQLTYAKADSRKIIEKMYKTEHVVCLSRKKLKIDRILAIVGKQASF